VKTVFCALLSVASLALATTGRAQSAKAAAPQAVAPAGPLILISIDGYRTDYLQRGFNPVIAALASDGVRAKAMRPAYPSITFPNHYTLVTGLYPDHHGVISNTMEDPAITPDSRFTLGDFTAVSDARWWDEATPIWVTAKQQGLHTATLFWPGSEAPIHGVRPDFWAHYDAAMTPDQRVDMVLDWLDLPVDKRPAFITLYFDQVDHQGHEHGPDSAEVDTALRQTDEAIGRLEAGLKARGLFDKANLVIVADHGMAATSAQRRIYLDDLTDVKHLHVVDTGALGELSADTRAASAAVIGVHPHMTCWAKADIPARLHYGANRRIQPIVCMPQVGWMVTTREDAAKQKDTLQGEHGYDPAASQMSALFVAHGPAFRHHWVEEGFDNVDVYPLLARVLGIKPEPNDGHLAEVVDMLAAFIPF
jgi:predicted AlkP superfamily pyrophosphatase or phosphodiesterase